MRQNWHLRECAELGDAVSAKRRGRTKHEAGTAKSHRRVVRSTSSSKRSQLQIRVQVEANKHRETMKRMLCESSVLLQSCSLLNVSFVRPPTRTPLPFEASSSAPPPDSWGDLVLRSSSSYPASWDESDRDGTRWGASLLLPSLE